MGIILTFTVEHSIAMAQHHNTLRYLVGSKSRGIIEGCLAILDDGPAANLNNLGGVVIELNVLGISVHLVNDHITLARNVLRPLGRNTTNHTESCCNNKNSV